MEIDRILVGTDTSDAAEHALATAFRLARATGAGIRALHAVDQPRLHAAAPAHDPRLAEEREQTGRRLAQDVREEAQRLGVETSTSVQQGDPGELLLDEAASWSADLLAVGTHGHGKLSRAILGSVADRLVREAPCPVLTARGPTDAGPSAPVDRLVVPSDGSQAALAAWPVTRALAEATGASLDLVYVVPPELEGGKYLDRPVTEVEEVHERMAAQALDPLEERCRRAGLASRRFVPHGPPHRELADHAERRDADLLVMATRGHGRFERVLVGGVADKLLRTASTPIVSVGPNA